MSAPDGGAPLAELERATIGRGGRALLREVDLAVRRGEWVALLGGNGVGKSTLLATLLGDEAPLAGAVRLAGRAPSSLPPRERARHVAVLPEAEPFAYDFSVAALLELGRYAHVGLLGRLGDADRAALARAVERTAIGPLLARGIQEPSAGERQRVLLARALAQEPALMLLDEPTAHLDPGRQQQLLATLRGEVDRGALGVLAVLHDPNVAGRFADRVLLLGRGSVLAQGAPADVLEPGLLEAAYGVPFRALRSDDGGPPWVFAAVAPVAKR